jgi:hypothetical protein
LVNGKRAVGIVAALALPVTAVIRAMVALLVAARSVVAVVVTVVG